MAKRQISARIEEQLLIEAKDKNINRTEVFEKALAEKLGYKIERGTKLIKLEESV